MIKHFREAHGFLIAEITGQEKLAFALSEHEDIYDLTEWEKRGGYHGSVIMFYDFENGLVYQPFDKKRNVIYGKPIFAREAYFFLGADYDAKILRLYRYLPGGKPETVIDLCIDEIDLYNIALMGDDVHVVSQGKGAFNCYYPERYSFDLAPNETADFIDGEKTYIEAWFEEGWDERNNCPSDEYRFYNKVLVKDHTGRVIYEEIGSIYQDRSGNHWIC